MIRKAASILLGAAIPGVAFAGTPGTLTYSLFGVSVACAAGAIFLSRKKKVEINITKADETLAELTKSFTKPTSATKGTKPSTGFGAAPTKKFGKEAFSENVLRKMDWKSMEILLAEVFKPADKISSVITTVFGNPDTGADIRITTEDGELTIIHCDKHKREFGMSELREFLGVKFSEKAVRGIVVSALPIGIQVAEAAKDNGIEMFDYAGIEHLVKNLSKDAKDNLALIALGGDFDRHSCPECGRKMPYPKDRRGETETWKCFRDGECEGTLVLPVPRQKNPSQS